MKQHNEQETDFYQFEKLITGLIENNYGCCDNFTSKSTSTGLRTNITTFKEKGEMHQSGIGNKKDYQKNKLIRGDKIKWLVDNSEDKYEAIVQNKIENFIVHLNSTCYTSINQFESHYASYEKNSFYKRHLDQFKNDKQRKYSIILYLNEKIGQKKMEVCCLYILRMRNK